jgi:aflatoxin B1 aldehyde reductase
MTDYNYPQSPTMSQDRHMGSMAAALRMKLENLPQLNMHNLSIHHAQQKRLSVELSSATSSRSAHSFSSQQSDDTDATDLTVTPNRSRASTFDNAERITSPLVQTVQCKPPLRVVLGTASVGSKLSPLAKITTVEEASKFVTLFRSRGYADIDTARAYPVGRGGTCEKLLGEEELRLGKWANVSTKVSSFMPGSHRAKNIAMSIDRSLEALNTDAVDVMYLHAPDRATPFKETCEAMNKAYLEGKFERFGLSNYSVEEVEQVVKVCEENGFVKPSVYQGQYNPICRGGEERLFEVLREHNIAFYAYSPSACGFFSNKVSRASTKDKNSRWNIASPLGAKYAGDYFHDPLFAAAELVRQQAKKYGISGHAAALRWTTWHSQLGAEYGDAVIVGASRISQLQENMDILEHGPLPEPLVETLNNIWEDVRAFEKGPRFSFV